MNLPLVAREGAPRWEGFRDRRWVPLALSRNKG